MSGPQKHYRHSIRLKRYDYSSPGAYFITIVTYRRECLFGEIVNGEMKLSDYGKVVNECLRSIPDHFPNVKLGAYVIMPNHVHGIIIINDGRGTIYRAPTVTRRIGHELNAAGIWQRNYYEHTIRNEREWNNIHLYIETNPTNWTDDEENPSRAMLESSTTKIE